MKRVTRKRLSLKGETLRELTAKALRVAVGGLPTEDSNIGEFCATTATYPSCQNTVCINDPRNTCGINDRC